MWTKTFWKDVAERAISTFGEVVLGIVGVAWINNPQILTTLSWPLILLAGSIGAVLAVLKGLVARLKGDKNSASLVK